MNPAKERKLATQGRPRNNRQSRMFANTSPATLSHLSIVITSLAREVIHAAVFHRGKGKNLSRVLLADHSAA